MYRNLHENTSPGAVFSHKLRYIVGLWLVEMAISTNHKPTIYRNLYENTGPVIFARAWWLGHVSDSVNDKQQGEQPEAC